MRFLPLVIVFASSCASTRSTRVLDRYGPWTVSIWSLAQEVPVVVVADVAGVRNDAPLLGVDTTSATLAVHQSLKGSEKGALEVAKENYWLCGFVRHPGVLLAGYRSIAFLSPRDGGLHPTHLRYPTSAEDLEDYVEVLRAAIERPGDKPFASREWVLLALSRRATRADGLTELSMSKLQLTDAELERLEADFVARPSVDQSLVGMMRLFKGRASSRLEEAFGNAIETMVSAGQEARVIFGAIDALEARLSCSRGEECADEPLSELESWQRARREGLTPSALWAKVKAERSLAPVVDGRVARWRPLAFGPNVQEPHPIRDD